MKTYPKQKKYRTAPIPKENKVTTDIPVYFPKSIYAILKAKSAELNLPMSQLTVIAVDNELDTPLPFNYPCDFPTSIFVEMAYQEEAGKIVEHLGKMRIGSTIQSLMTARRDMGIMSRTTFMLALRELFEVDMVEFYNPPKESKFKYDAHQYIRLKPDIAAHIRRDKYRRPATIEKPKEEVKDDAPTT